jgi:ABC-type polysaccharide/polyol phosphate transport system ATPase subunit
MSEPIITARKLTKVYRLYKKPHYRLLDLIGLLPAGGDAYSEHRALWDVDLTIGRAERVAIIGRNGAGKSTLLKLVTQVVVPTSGTIEVAGEVHALLQIGTGFHPDFTGRENVHAYLAQLGVTGEEAKARYREIVEFAELEEYADQPLKTYSTGMSVRLMFSTATAITPDILVLDEVLGVGDAYFAHKSYERIRGLAEGHGTTLLLVTHDLYSAASLCERVVWIDRGRILMDGRATEVIKAYEDSIRAQEERRLRGRRLAALAAASVRDSAERLLLEVQTASGMPPEAPVYFSRIALCHDARTLQELPLGADAFSPGRSSQLVAEGSNWGDVEAVEGKQVRPFLNYGQPYHKVAGLFGAVPHSDTRSSLAVEFEYRSSRSVSLRGRMYGADKFADLGLLPPSAGRWVRHRANVTWEARAAGSQMLRLSALGVHGVGDIQVTNFQVLNAAGEEVHHVTHGSPADIVVHYAIARADLCERAQVLIAFQRDGVADVCRFITRDLLFDARQARSGIVRLHVPRLTVGAGTYALSLMVAEAGYYDREQVVFYSINPGVYTCLSRAFDLVVEGGGIVGTGTGFVAEGEWSLEPATPLTTSSAQRATDPR